MITNILLDIVYAFVSLISRVVASFGEVSENNSITSAIVSMKDYYVSLNDYLPLDVILAIIAFSLAFELVFFFYKLIRWGYQKIPGIS